MHGYDEDKAKVIARLRRIEGQVRAITQMVEDDKYCIDILIVGMHDRYTIFVILQPLGRSCNRIQILIDSDQSTFVRKPLADL